MSKSCFITTATLWVSQSSRKSTRALPNPSTVAYSHKASTIYKIYRREPRSTFY